MCLLGGGRKKLLCFAKIHKNYLFCGLLKKKKNKIIATDIQPFIIFFTVILCTEPSLCLSFGAVLSSDWQSSSGLRFPVRIHFHI